MGIPNGWYIVFHKDLNKFIARKISSLFAIFVFSSFHLTVCFINASKKKENLLNV